MSVLVLVVLSAEDALLLAELFLAALPAVAFLWLARPWCLATSDLLTLLAWLLLSVELPLVVACVEELVLSVEVASDAKAAVARKPAKATTLHFLIRFLAISLSPIG